MGLSLARFGALATKYPKYLLCQLLLGTQLDVPNVHILCVGCTLFDPCCVNFLQWWVLLGTLLGIQLEQRGADAAMTSLWSQPSSNCSGSNNCANVVQVEPGKTFLLTEWQNIIKGRVMTSLWGVTYLSQQRLNSKNNICSSNSNIVALILWQKYL